MSKSFDLTTNAGLGNATLHYGVLGFIAGLGPLGWLVEGAYNLIHDYMGSGRAPTIKQQEEAAIAIIKAGKESGADEIEIALDQAAGVTVAGTFKQASGDGSINANLGKNGKMVLKVKYK